MTEWVRAASDCLCGRCAAPIRADVPILLVIVPGVQKPRIRCQTCAVEPVPDLPAAMERTPIRPSHRMLPLRAWMPSVLSDWKLKQSGEREPGMDDE